MKEGCGHLHHSTHVDIKEHFLEVFLSLDIKRNPRDQTLVSGLQGQVLLPIESYC